MLVLGIDPGTATTGFGLIEKKGGPDLKVIEWGLIETNKNDNPGQRLSEIHKQISELLKRVNPQVLAMEKVFFTTNAKTVIRVGQAQGIILLAAANYNVDVEEYSPMTIKKIVAGNGRAKKEEVQAKVKEFLGEHVTSDKRVKKTHFDNAADALAIALCHIIKTHA